MTPNEAVAVYQGMIDLGKAVKAYWSDLMRCPVCGGNGYYWQRYEGWPSEKRKCYECNGLPLTYDKACYNRKLGRRYGNA